MPTPTPPPVAPRPGTDDPLDVPLVRVLGDKTAKVLASSLDLRTVGDLLRHYPRRYVTRGELTEIGSLRQGDHVTIMAKVVRATSRPMRQRRGSMQQLVVTDGSNELDLTFFKQPWRVEKLQPGTVGLFAGTVSVYRGRRQLTHPSMVLLDADDDEAGDYAARYASELIPVYPASAKAQTWTIDKAVRIVLDHLVELDDPVPRSVRDQHGLMGLTEALRAIHRPADRDQLARARARLRFDEAFALQALLAQRRRELRALPAVSRVSGAGGLLSQFDLRSPFELTAGQREVGEQIERDLASTHPMHRLLQGEVGSGKTLVALRAMLAAVDAGGQAALLAPTEVLAQQHHRSITALLGPLAERGRLGGADHGTRVALLTGSQSTGRRRGELLDVVSGDAGIVIGTHALLEDVVEFHDLALVVIDEQHRFGVEQRAALTAKSRDGQVPHVLVMTATPIPRTVAMTVFGDLDVSTLTELPRGRSPITTHVVPAIERPAYLDRTWARIREEVAVGHKAFVVCPRIGDDAGPEEETGAEAYDRPEPVGPGPDGSGPDRADRGAGGGSGDPSLEGDADGADEQRAPRGRPPLAVLDVLPLLVEGPLAGLRVAMLHGRMPADWKDQAMRRFALPAEDPEALDVLVATTVIEVGVDVPAATVMVVMDADRFGISQLHQLRGRVGRGRDPGLCLLVTDAETGSPARERLDAVAATADGFALSRLDLQLRREGDVLGSQQSGRRSSLRLLEVLRHEDVVLAARDAATAVVEDDPELRQHPALAREVAALREEERSDYLDKT
ncbi:MAG: ATP-dependent DNA helicase RecG [Candidatus Nanopelagicales bacterium]